MDIANRLGLSQLATKEFFSKISWEYMAGGVIKVVPLYKNGQLENRTNNKRSLQKAQDLFRQAIKGLEPMEQKGKYIVGNLKSAIALEICLHIFLLRPEEFEIKEWASVKERLSGFERAMGDILQGKPFQTSEEKELSRICTFFQIFAEMCRTKRAVNIF